MDMSKDVPACARGAAAVLLFALGACTSSSPAAPEPEPSATRVTASGIAYAFSATGERRPVPNLRLKVRADAGADGTDLADAVTDSAGRYTLADVQPGPYFFQTAPGSDYRFLCSWYGISVRAARLGPPPSPFNDLAVVHVDWSGNEPPPGMWTLGTTVWGTVSEQTAVGLLPVANATVQLEEGRPDPPATTNAGGFYMICSQMGMNQERVITARKDGYTPVSRGLYGGFDRIIHFEIARKN